MTTMTEKPAMIEEIEEDEDDDMANLFSFGSGEGSDVGAGGTNSPHGGDTVAGVTSVLPSLSSLTSTRTTLDGTSIGGADSPDSFLELLAAEINLGLGGSGLADSGGLSLEEHDPDTRDILQWLENTDDSPEGTELVVFTSQIAPPKPPPLPIPTATLVALPPTFASLDEALASNESTQSQIRSFYRKELQVHLRSDKANELSTILSGSRRVEVYCRMICNKCLKDVLNHSLADSFDQWKTTARQEDDRDHAYKTWIKPYQEQLSLRIAEQTLQQQAECEVALVDLLLYHKHQNSTGGSATLDSGASLEEVHDTLLPMVVAVILSSGPIPVAGAAVLLSQIVPNFMPLLALSSVSVNVDGSQCNERWEASLMLHSEFYLLACYHLPLLVFHLDRYMPGWHWPVPVSPNDMDSLDSDLSASSAVAIGRNLQKQGQIPSSWLLCHLAGECSGTSLPTSTIQMLWDNILTDQNNAMRFFLVLAVLERYAPALLLLVGDDLTSALRKIWTLESIDDNKEPKDKEWSFEWWPQALCLQQSTPESVHNRLQKVEDEAIQASLRRRQERAEAALRARLEAEATAHKEAQEAKADEARHRLSRARLVAFYRKHAPDKESNIDKIMEAYEGRLDLLDVKLKGIYGEGFGPAVKAKPSPPPRVSSKLLATMNQGLGRMKPANENHTDEYEEERKPDFVSVRVTPEEVLPVLCWSKEATSARGVNYSRRRRNGQPILKFYLVDSRSEETAKEQGRFPTAVNLSPEVMMDPEQMQQHENMFESLRGAVHIVIMGEGFNAIPNLYNQKLSPKLQELMEQDEGRTNSCALFFQKRGFCFVSLLDGGFCSAHSWLVREGSRHHLSASAVLVDYSPDATLFGQLETLHNASTAGKAQRKMASLIEASIVTMTKRAYQLEMLASEIDSNEVRQGLRMTLFGRGDSSANGVPEATIGSSPSVAPPDEHTKPVLSVVAITADVDTLSESTQETTTSKVSAGSAVPSFSKLIQGSGTSKPKEEALPASNPFRGFGAAFSQTRARFTANSNIASQHPETAPVGTTGAGVGAAAFGFNQLRKTAMSRVTRNATTKDESASQQNNDGEVDHENR